MENNNRPVQSSITPTTPKKWYQHKGIIAILILTFIAAAVCSVYLKNENGGNQTLIAIPDMSPIPPNPVATSCASKNIQLAPGLKKEAPADAIAVANKLIASRVGMRVFSNHICLGWSENDTPYQGSYGIIYLFVSPLDANDRAFNTVEVDKATNKASLFQADNNFPDCINDSSKCEIKITSDAAIRIAQSKWQRQWKIDPTLRYSPSSDSFYWIAYASDTESKDNYGFPMKDSIAIDAVSGKVLSKSIESGIN